MLQTMTFQTPHSYPSQLSRLDSGDGITLSLLKMEASGDCSAIIRYVLYEVIKGFDSISRELASMPLGPVSL